MEKNSIFRRPVNLVSRLRQPLSSRRSSRIPPAHHAASFIGRLSLGSALLIFLITPLFMTSCANPTPPADDPEPLERYFKSAMIDIRRQADETLVIRFENAAQATVEVRGKFNGTGQVLYNQGGLVLELTADDLVRLSGPYTDTDGHAGASAYDVRSDKTAVRMLHAGVSYDYLFHFADGSTGEVAYTARLVEVNGQPQAEFADMSANVMGRRPVTVTYHADTSKVLDFDNPYGCGAAGLNVRVPVIYAGVAATLAGLAQLKVYEKTDGSYIVDYLDATGWVLSHSEAAVEASDQTLYSENGVTIVLKSTGEAYLTEPITGGTRTYAMNPAGIVVEHEQIGADNVYDVHFVNQLSGKMQYTARIIKIGANWFADFLSPISEKVPVERVPDIFGNIMYRFVIDNAAGSGTVIFWTGTSSHIKSTTYTHS